MPRDALNGRKIIRVEYAWVFDATTCKQVKYVSAVVLNNGHRLVLNHTGERREDPPTSQVIPASGYIRRDDGTIVERAAGSRGER